MTTSGTPHGAADSSGATAGGPTSAEEIPAPPHAADDPAIPEDEQELRAEIEQTREQLGQTVEQLAAKADVKARARAKMGEMTGKLKGKTAQARGQAAGRGGAVREQVTGKTVLARQKAMSGTAQLQARVGPAWQKAPEPVRRTVTKGAATVKQRRLPLAAGAVALAAGYLVLRWWRKR